MYDDPEIKAMNDCHEAIKHLDESVRNRVIRWLSSKFSTEKLEDPFKKHDQNTNKINDTVVDIGSYETVDEIFTKINPQTDADKVLVIAAFLQEKFKKQELTGWEINKELTRLGHGVNNVTQSVTQLINKQPNLMIQTRKEGKTKQAKKKYKVTSEGVKAVQEMVTQQGN